jgi:methylphosphotriester-DNA--protein-cysteine methyltransferase
MYAYAAPLSVPPTGAFMDLCRLYDVLLTEEAPTLPETARTDLRAFARLFDLALEEACEAEVWAAVRRRLADDLAPALQVAAEWGYEDQKQAA